MNKKTTKTATLAIALVFALALALTACDNKPDTHTHEWEWVETAPATPTAEGLETETCKTCGATNGTRPIAKLPNPNQTAITAFGKTATVTGDPAIPAEDFEAAVGKLETILTEMEGVITVTGVLASFATMLSRPIKIVQGNTGPDADANKSMTIGVVYLNTTTDDNTIKGAIFAKVYTDNAFAD